MRFIIIIGTIGIFSGFVAALIKIHIGVRLSRRPFASARESSFRDGPLGVFSPRSHCDIVVGDMFRW
jgi:hypothetical protein